MIEVAILDIITALRAFMSAGGGVLWIIAVLTLVMWSLIIDRIWYYKTELKQDVEHVVTAWQARPERQSWQAHAVREKMISEVSLKVNNMLPMIKTLVALCPLLGLLGTVTGMIQVFEVLGFTGGGDAKQMASGVSKATIPTMAGMVAAISGVFGNMLVTRIAERENQLLADHLTME